MKKIRKGLRLAASSPAFLWRRAAQSIGIIPPRAVYYVVPGANWSTDWDSHYITSAVRKRFDLPIFSTDTPHLLTGHLIHYGQVGEFLVSLGTKRNKRNDLVATIFHGDMTNLHPKVIKNTETFIKNAHLLRKVVTACSIMEQRLIGWGIPASKIANIPLGVDIAHFRPVTQSEKSALRQRIGIPDDAFCVGSFQKDGVGWGAGLEPKLIKGPDLFLEVMHKLKPTVPNLHVVLTGPSRGYVKQGLDRLGIPYVHTMLEHYPDIVRFYQMLDCYLVASREEGGPKAVLESMATGVPLVTTRVGLAPDLVKDGQNGFLVDVEDVERMTARIETLYQAPELVDQLISNGLETAAHHTWHEIGQRYYHEVYAPLIHAQVS